MVRSGNEIGPGELAVGVAAVVTVYALGAAALESKSPDVGQPIGTVVSEGLNTEGK